MDRHKAIMSFDFKQIKKIKTMKDFYTVLNLNEDMMRAAETLLEIKMNRDQCEELLLLLKKNNRGILKNKYKEIGISLDWTLYSPRASREVPENELWIFKGRHNEV